MKYLMILLHMSSHYHGCGDCAKLSGAAAVQYPPIHVPA